jgi:hypothetical protein
LLTGNKCMPHLQISYARPKLARCPGLKIMKVRCWH